MKKMKKGITPIMLAILIVVIIVGILFIRIITDESMRSWSREVCYSLARRTTFLNLPSSMGIVCSLMFG